MEPLSTGVISLLGLSVLYGFGKTLLGGSSRTMLPAPVGADIKPPKSSRPRRSRQRRRPTIVIPEVPEQVPEPEPMYEPEPLPETEPEPVPEMPPIPEPPAPEPPVETHEPIGEEVQAEVDEFAERLDREGAATGDVQVSLMWDNHNDLDLSVICPSGERISFDNRFSQCGGRLDVDMNESDTSSEPIENVFWPRGQSPIGRYRVFVEHFEKHGGDDETHFRILVRTTDGNREFQGSISNRDPPLEVCQFDVAPSE